jgi:hypothetical protein
MNAFRVLNGVGEQKLPSLMPFIETGYTSQRHLLPILRFAVHLLGGGSDQVESILLWLASGQAAGNPVARVKSDPEAAHHALQLFVDVWPMTKGYPRTRDNLARYIRRLIAARDGEWTSNDLLQLVAMRSNLEAAGFTVDTINQAIGAIETVNWLTGTGKVLGVHALFWTLLVVFYPRLPLVQALFFWNPWVRRIAGLGYVGLLLAWVPPLRRILFSPFRASLLSDAALENFSDVHYYPNSLAPGPPGPTGQPGGRRCTPGGGGDPEIAGPDRAGR